MKRIGIAGLAAVAALALAAGAWARAEKSMVGQKLPELKLDFLDAKADVPGKPVILEFWATWCPPCRQSIPHMNEIYKKYKDQGLVIIGVTNEDRADVKGFMKDVPIDYPVALDRKLGKEFGVTGIPHAVLADKTGQVVWEGHPMSLKNADIEKLLK